VSKANEVDLSEWKRWLTVPYVIPIEVLIHYQVEGVFPYKCPVQTTHYPRNEISYMSGEVSSPQMLRLRIMKANSRILYPTVHSNPSCITLFTPISKLLWKILSDVKIHDIEHQQEDQKELIKTKTLISIKASASQTFKGITWVFASTPSCPKTMRINFQELYALRIIFTFKTTKIIEDNLNHDVIS
jgi:hypothetical protein